MENFEWERRPPDSVIKLDMERVMKLSLRLTVAAAVLLFAGNALLHRGVNISFSFSGFFIGLLLFAAGYLGLLVLHEAFHLLGFRIFGGVPFRKMAFGVNLKLGIAYATTEVPLRNRAMRKALLLPLWMTGIVPAAIGLWLDSYLLLFISAWLIGGAAGDLEMDRQLKELPGDWLIRDDPQEPKLYAYAPKGE